MAHTNDKRQGIENPYDNGLESIMKKRSEALLEVPPPIVKRKADHIYERPPSPPLIPIPGEFDEYSDSTSTPYPRSRIIIRHRRSARSPTKQHTSVSKLSVAAQVENIELEEALFPVSQMAFPNPFKPIKVGLEPESLLIAEKLNASLETFASHLRADPGATTILSELAEAAESDTDSVFRTVFDSVVKNSFPQALAKHILGTSGIVIFVASSLHVLYTRDRRSIMVMILSGLASVLYTKTLRFEQLMSFFTTASKERSTTPVSQMFTTEVDTFATLLVTCLSATVVRGAKSGTAISEVVKSLSNFNRMKSSLADIAKLVISGVETLVNAARKHIFHSHPLRFFSTNSVAIDELLSEADNLCYEVDANMFVKNEANFFRLKSLIDRVNSVIRSTPKNQECRDLNQALTFVFKRLDELRKEMVASNYKFSGVRQEPAGVLFSGSPGIGKTIMILHLSIAIMSALLSSEEEQARLRENPFDYIYNRQAENKYWTGYKPMHKIILMDDFLQNKTVAGIADNEGMDLIRAGNCFQHSLHMAEIESKGNSFNTSEFILATTNVIDLSCDSIHDINAIKRRFPFAFVVTLPEQFCTTETSHKDFYHRKPDFTTFPKDIDGVPKMDPSVLRFYRQDLLSGKQTDEEYTFDEVVDMILKDHKCRQVWHRQNLNSLAEVQAKYAASTATPQPFDFDLKMEPVSQMANVGQYIASNVFGHFEDDASSESSVSSVRYADHVPSYSHEDEALAFRLDALKRLRSDWEHPQHKSVMAKVDIVVRAITDHFPHIICSDSVDLIADAISIYGIDLLDHIETGTLLSTHSLILEYVTEDVTDFEVPLRAPPQWNCSTVSARSALDVIKDKVSMVAESVMCFSREAYDYLTGPGRVKLLAILATVSLLAFGLVKSGLLNPLFRLFRATGCASVYSWLQARYEANKKYNQAEDDAWEVRHKVYEIPFPNATPPEVQTTVENFAEDNSLPLEFVLSFVPIEAQSGMYSRDKDPNVKKVQALSAKQMRAKVSSAKSQFGFKADKNGDDIIRSIIGSNQWTFEIETGVGSDIFKKVGHILMIRGTIGLVPKHYINWLFDLAEQGDEFLELKVRMSKIIVNPKNKPYHFDWKLSEVLEGAYDEHLADNDLCLVHLPRGMRLSTDIVDYFMPAKFIADLKVYHGKLFLPGPTGLNTESAECKYLPRELTIHNEVLDEHYTVNKTLVYPVPTASGDCGSILMLSNPSYPKEKIAAIHGAGTGKLGIGLCTVREDILNCLQTIPGVHVIDNNLVDPREVPFGDGTFERLDTLEKPVSQIAATTIMRSKIGSWADRKKTPALLAPNPKRGIPDPYLKAVAKFAKPPVFVDRDLVHAVADSVFDRLVSVSAPSTVGKRLLSYEEVAFGNPAIEGLEGMNRSTSAGYPLSQERRPGFRGKEWLLGKAGEPRSTLPEDIKTELQQLEEMLTNMQRPDFVYTDTIKDELLALAKVLMGKSRLFSAQPQALALLYGKYFGAFGHWMNSNPIFNDCGVGLNPYSVHWDVMAQQLLRFGETNNVGAGDYSAFDASEQPVVLWGIFGIIQKWYDGPPIDNIIREVLWYEVVNSRHVRGDVIYQWHVSIPSGNNLTIIINNLYNMMAFKLAWLHLHDNQLWSLTIYHDHVEVKYMGDDNIFSVSSAYCDKFTEQFLEKTMPLFGLTYTSADKSGAKPLRTLLEVDFLQRSFRREPKYCRWVAPLKLDTVLEIPMWTKKGHMSDQIVKDNVDVALRELTLHGSEIFHQYAPQMIKELYEEYHLSPRCSNYRTLLDFVLTEAKLIM